MTTARKEGLRSALLTGALAGVLTAQPAFARQSTPEALWTAAEAAERDARRSSELNADPALNAYVRDVACRVAPEYCVDLRVQVMDRPGFHAGMAPNGYLEVWSGLLLRVGSEAELAFVLGHEIGHVDANHPVEQRNALKTRLGAAMAVGAVASAAGAYYAVDLSAVGDMARHGAVAASDDYSLAQEIEADRIGFERLVKAGYDPGAAADLWRSRQDDGIAADRVTALETLGAASPEGWRRERDAWRAAIRPHLAGWLADDLRRRDFEGALALTARLERDGMDAGVLGFHRGEIYRLRREEGDAERARDAYLAASGYTDAPVAVWRELGDVQARLGRNAEARAAWRTYLERAPTAEDRWIVEDSLAALGGS